MMGEPRVEDATIERRTWTVAGMIAGLVFVVYSNTFRVPFLLDDFPSIVANASAHRIWPLSVPFHPPNAGQTVTGRPLLNFSFALNWAAGGASVIGYHVVNLMLHIGSALLLLGIIRRTLEGLSPRRWSSGEILIASSLATLLWAVHPLQTETVAYIVQRAEGLMGFFYLVTLYTFIRGARQSGHPWRWWAISALTCLGGMATKEVMATAPLAVLFYDRVFVADSWRQIWARRMLYYVALASGWIVLGILVLRSGTRGGTVGAISGASAGAFAAAQATGIWHYLRLCFWPRGLIFDYGTVFSSMGIVTLVAASMDLAILAGLLIAAIRGSKKAFLALWFILVLLPSSSFIGGTRQTLAEHRVYLSLAGVTVALVLFLFTAFGRRGLALAAILAALAGTLAHSRNAIYRSETALWADTVAKQPGNAWAQNDYGVSLSRQSELAQAEIAFRESLRLNPRFAEAHNNYGNVLLRQGRYPEAAKHFAEGISLNALFVEPEQGIATALTEMGDINAAEPHARRAVALAPQDAVSQNTLGAILAGEGRYAESTMPLREAIRLDPAYVAAYNNLGNSFLQLGEFEQAKEMYQSGERTAPRDGAAQYNLGKLDLRSGDFAGATQKFSEALLYQPGNASAEMNLGSALLALNRNDDALAHYRRALELAPHSALGHYNFANALVHAQKYQEAVREYERARQLQRPFPEADGALQRVQSALDSGAIR